MLVKNIKAVDVHSHYGKYIFSSIDVFNKMMSADIDLLLKLQGAANTACSIVSPLKAMGLGEDCDPVLGNDITSEIADSMEGIYQWVVVLPDVPETFKQAEKRLLAKKCVGIKIHPDMHEYRIKDKGEKLFELANAYHAVVLSHSGGEVSQPEDFVGFADKYTNVKLILAHLGYNWDDEPFHQAYAIQTSKNGNIYTDTSSAKMIVPNLLEQAVDMIGADKILYGSDAPLYFSPMHRVRIDNAIISEEDKYKILAGNSQKVFGDIFDNMNLG